jgi:hypothetical protein
VGFSPNQKPTVRENADRGYHTKATATISNGKGQMAKDRGKPFQIGKWQMTNGKKQKAKSKK